MGKRKSTKFPGVQARESTERRHKGRPDVCFTIDYRDASGKRIRKDVGWASEGFTAALAAEMRSRLVNEAKTRAAMGDIPLPSRTPVLTLEQAWIRYKTDWLEANGKASNSDTSRLQTDLKSLCSLPLNQITAHRLDQLMGDMRTAGKSAQTIRHAVGLIRRIMRRMSKWKLYTGPMPFDALTMPKTNNARERFLTPTEARDLLAELGRRSKQTWLMALISLHCGLRFGEVARLRWGDVRIAERTIYIAESKSGRARHAVMTDEVASTLETLPKGTRTALLFPARDGGVMKAVSETFNRAVDALGLNDTGEVITRPDGSSVRPKIQDRRQRVVFHSLRHTYASWLACGGQGQLTIADRLGHHSLEMTKRYTHLMDATRSVTAQTISETFHTDDPELRGNQR